MAAIKARSKASSKAVKTPRKASTHGVANKASISKSKGKPKVDTRPNGNILKYFKRTADETLFVDDGKTSEFFEITEEEDAYGTVDVKSESRYNEVEVPVKRMRLSPGSEKTNAASSSTREECSARTLLPQKQPGGWSQKKRPKKKPGPFLDDSSDEDEDDNVSGWINPTMAETTPPDVGTVEGIRWRPVTGSNPVREATSVDDGHDDIETRPRPESSTGQPEAEDLEAFSDLNTAQVDEEDEFAGEETRMMRLVEEEARLAAEVEEAGNQDCDKGTKTEKQSGEMTTECCPICHGSLDGATVEVATAHVNSCLDEKATPLVKPPATLEAKIEETLDAPAMGKRFIRAGVARPGQANPINIGGSAADKGSTSAFSKLMSSHAEDVAWTLAAAAEKDSRGKPAYERTCPFYKTMPNFNICVDAFRYGKVAGCNAYFLSHFHSDHYIGLTARWDHGPIYCSAVTGSLVKSQLGTAARWVVELAFEETVDVAGTKGVRVTMIPANHCPGSSLFLFEKRVGPTRTQRILHCGDFRACPAHVRHGLLKPDVVDAVSGKTRQQKIDVCYLDTTYLNPRYSFPPQDDVIKACAELCVQVDASLRSGDESVWRCLAHRREGGPGGPEPSVIHFFAPEAKTGADSDRSAASQPTAYTCLGQRNKTRLLIVCGTYSIGKERICKAIAQALGTKIFASKAKIRIIRQLGDAELTALMTTDPYEAQVHMQMLMELRADTLAAYLECYRAHFARIIAIRPSGWSYRPANGAKPPPANLPPGSVPTTQLLHGAGWRTSFSARDLVPQRGSDDAAMCFGVPYSEHSSFRELALFLMALRVEKVVPTVNVGSEQSRKRMKAWTDRWLTERRRGGMVTVLGMEQEGRDVGIEKGGRMKFDVGLWEGRDGNGGGVHW